MSVAGVNVAVSEAVTKVTASSGTKIAVALSEQATNIKINNFAIPVASTAAAIAFTPYGALTATNIADAIQQLADQNFRSPDAPTGSNVGEGDIWYDTDDDELKVYRETSTGVFQWVPIIVGAAGSDSDTLDAGAF